MINSRSTIVALASAAGKAGVAVVRLSGPLSHEIAVAVTHFQKAFLPRHATFVSCYDDLGTVFDQGLVLYFPSPNSFTGEEVIEFQVHGGMVIVDWLIERCIQLGAVLASAGQFSERAFLNDKIDLSQAEAIADLIDSQSRRAVQSSVRSLQGEFSEKIRVLVEDLIGIRTHIEAAIDFVDEDLETEDLEILSQRLASLLTDLETLIQATHSGVILQEGVSIAISGKPNAGKSRLLNVLAKAERAIVTDIPGTTRDIITEKVTLGGIPLQILDTAGLRYTSDKVESIGIERAQQAVKKADIIVLVFDSSTDTANSAVAEFNQYCDLSDQQQLILVENKIDLTGAPEALRKFGDHHLVSLSLETRCGFTYLEQAISQELIGQSLEEDVFIARRRHLEALDKAQFLIKKALLSVSLLPLEVIAEELKVAQNHINTITGAFTSDDLLGRIFSSFCIGK